MLIDDENIRVQYDSTAESPIMAGDALPFPFRFIEKEQVKAILLDGTKLVFNEDYTVGLEEEEEEKPEGEDEASVSSDYTSVILNIDIPIGETITLYRETDLDQTSEFPQEARFSSRKIEDALDKLTMQNQEQREALGRAMKLPLTAAVDLKDLALPNPEPNKSVKWNSDGTALVNTSFDPDTALATTENFKKQAETAANNANQSAQAAAGSAAAAAQKENIINDISTDYLNQINDRGTTILKDADAIINRVGWNMFDTVLKDHELSYPDNQGLALQGTYVYHDADPGIRYGYPDFYNKCVEECDEAATKGGVQKITLSGTTIDMYIHDNGHMYYDISIKSSIDTWFNTFGTAWFYGVDKANKRIFLPRNNWFEQGTNVVGDVGKSIEAGLPTHTHTRGTMEISGWAGMGESHGAGGAFNPTHGSAVGGSTSIGGSTDWGFDFYASRTWSGSTSTGNYSSPLATTNTVQPKAVKKLLYICVGNTVSDTSWVDVVTQVKEGVKDIEEAKDEAVDAMKSAVGGTVPIGFIGSAILGIDETLNLQRYLNGQIILQDQFKGFTKFLKKRVELYPSVACTESEWQTEVTMSAFSQCGKFVIDDNAGTIRLPKVVNMQGLTDLSKLAEIVEAGLPNITGNVGSNSGIGHVANVSYGLSVHNSEIHGAFYANNNCSYTATRQVEQGTNGKSLGFDASRSNSIYGKANTVQQEQIQYPYFIQVATGAETEDNIINEIELNNPYSLLDVKWSDKLLNNVSWLRSQGQANSKAIYNDVYDLILREYNSGTDETETVGGVSITFRRGSRTNIKVTTNKLAYDRILSATGTAWYYVIDATNETFYLPQSNGLLQFGGNGNFVEAGLPNITGTIYYSRDNQYQGTSTLIDSWTLQETATSSQPGVSGSRSAIYSGTGVFDASNVAPIYGKSNTVQPNAVKGYLYFYVGETVQNANLINAGRIEEKIASLIPDNSSLIASYAIPSNKYIDLTVGASGTKYTAPANGWFCAYCYMTSTDAYLDMNVQGIYHVRIKDKAWNSTDVAQIIPIKKGNTLSLNHSGVSFYTFRFIYAEGEV